jgi:hypothetical protein
MSSSPSNNHTYSPFDLPIGPVLRRSTAGTAGTERTEGVKNTPLKRDLGTSA